MIDKKNLKSGDEVVAIYTDSYASSGRIDPFVIKKITKELITATRKSDKWDIEFINDDEMQEKTLANRYHRTQSYKLFLGTAEEAEKADDKRCEAEEYYVDNQDFIINTITRASLEDLKKIVKILKKYGKN